MRWCLTAVLFVGLVCTVRSEGDDEPTLRIMSRSTVYDVGETRAIFCKGTNLVEPINWLSPKNVIIGERSNKNSRIFVERKSEEDGIVAGLFIHQIKIVDGGNWTCSSGQLSESREFIVGEKVKIADKNVSIEGEEGKSVKLTCEANGYPTPIVVWYKEKQQIRVADQPRKYSIKPDHTLEIKKLNHADVGLYTCKVRQKLLSHYTEKIVQLSVQHKPILINKDNEIIVFKTEEVYAILNDTKNVTCSAIANPPPTYRWYKRINEFDDGPITDPDTVINSEDGTSSVLVLRMYDESYVGEYKCTANNSRGAQSIIFHVSLGNKPDPPDVVSLYRANYTELTFNVSCSTCETPKNEELSSNPEDIIGYFFQLVTKQENYGADWDLASEFEFDYIVNNTLYTLGPLPNSTKFYVRVRTRNSAGYSDWVEIPGDIATANQWKLAATALVVIAACLFTLF